MWWKPWTWNRIKTVVVIAEPEWDTEQVDLLLALELFKRDLGPNGELMSEATSEAADPNNYRDPLRYVSHGPFTNWAEKAKQDAIDAFKKDSPDANMNGMYWTVEKQE